MQRNTVIDKEEENGTIPLEVTSNKNPGPRRPSQSKMVVTSHRWLLSPWNVAGLKLSVEKYMLDFEDYILQRKIK